MAQVLANASTCSARHRGCATACQLTSADVTAHQVPAFVTADGVTIWESYVIMQV